MKRVATTLLFLVGCEASDGYRASLVVPTEVGSQYSEASPGELLLTSAMTLDGLDEAIQTGRVSRHAVLCGESGTYRVRSDGFGCVGERDWLAWIAPLPESEIGITPCGASTEGIPEEWAKDGFVASLERPQDASISFDEGMPHARKVSFAGKEPDSVCNGSGYGTFSMDLEQRRRTLPRS